MQKKRGLFVFVQMIAVLLLIGHAHTPAYANQGRMLKSDRNRRLAINAWNGAKHGTILRLHRGCRANNPDCTWIYRNGMLLSARNPRLAINAWNGAKHGTILRLHRGCRANNPDCTWTYRNGMLLSARNPRLAINAWNGAKHGTILRLHRGCRANNPDCTWKFFPTMHAGQKYAKPRVSAPHTRGCPAGMYRHTNKMCCPSEWLKPPQCARRYAPAPDMRPMYHAFREDRQTKTGSCPKTYCKFKRQ